MSRAHILLLHSMAEVAGEVRGSIGPWRQDSDISQYLTMSMVMVYVADGDIHSHVSLLTED